jgi:hypothetical protein
MLRLWCVLARALVFIVLQRERAEATTFLSWRRGQNARAGTQHKGLCFICVPHEQLSASQPAGIHTRITNNEYKY